MRIAVVGAGGRTGQHILRAVVEQPEAKLVAALEHKDHPLVGTDVGMLVGAGPKGVKVQPFDDTIACDAVIDFSGPSVAPLSAGFAVKARASCIIGTTGLDAAAKGALEDASAQVPVVAAPNMSVGVNVVLELLKKATQMLGDAFDFEVFEIHHKAKVDSPSGTALRMGEVVAGERSLSLEAAAHHGRRGAVGPRQKEEIGIHAARGGDVVGEHTAIFAGPAERVEIVHRAHSREVFARGAVRAALWADGQAPGLYSMQDVLSQGE